MVNLLETSMEVGVRVEAEDTISGERRHAQCLPYLRSNWP